MASETQNVSKASRLNITPPESASDTVHHTADPGTVGPTGSGTGLYKVLHSRLHAAKVELCPQSSSLCVQDGRCTASLSVVTRRLRRGRRGRDKLCVVRPEGSTRRPTGRSVRGLRVRHGAKTASSEEHSVRSPPLLWGVHTGQRRAEPKECSRKTKTF